LIFKRVYDFRTEFLRQALVVAVERAAVVALESAPVAVVEPVDIAAVVAVQARIAAVVARSY